MISNLAYIHPDAKIGENVTIEPFAVIYDKVEIGDGTWIGPNVTVMPGALIGKNCKIHPGAVIANIPQDLKFAGEETWAVIGDNTVIRECATINRGTSDKHKTVVGKDCLLMAYVHIAHDCVIEDRCVISNAVQVGGHVEIGYHVTIGGTSALHQFVKIGAHAMVGGGALVRKDVPPYVVASREPLTFEGINLVGLRRRNFSNETIGLIQEIYKMIYYNGLNVSDGVSAVEQQYAPSEERNLIIDFIRNSERGIIRG